MNYSATTYLVIISTQEKVSRHRYDKTIEEAADSVISEIGLSATGRKDRPSKLLVKQHLVLSFQRSGVANFETKEFTFTITDADALEDQILLPEEC